MKTFGLFILLTAALSGAELAVSPWPQFRGRLGNGHLDAADSSAVPGHPIEWAENKNVAWKTAIPHKGWSTPVLIHGMLWLTTATPEGREFFALCLDQKSGRILVEKKLFHSDSPEPLGNPVNGYASPSPLADGAMVFVHFGSYGTAALDAKSGNEIWRRTDLPCRHYRGPGSSLAQFRDTLIVTMDGVDFQYLVALDKQTGKTRWKVDRTTDFGDLGPDGKPTLEGDLRKAYTTPLVVEPAGARPWFISIGAKASYGYDAATGAELWKVTYPGFSNASSPLYSHGLAFINTGYGKANLLAYKVDGATRGDVTKSGLEWDCLKRVPQRASPIIVGDFLYMVDDGGFCSCLEVKTGAIKWSERLDGNYSGSPVFASGHLYFCSEQGDSYVLKPDPSKLAVAAHNRLDSGMLASPAADSRALFLRTKSHLYRIESK
ncbi:MAG: PQQ-binding-like beta-propeller repeat protein [Verrucomicrobiales bacterium]